MIFGCFEWSVEFDDKRRFWIQKWFRWFLGELIHSQFCSGRPFPISLWKIGISGVGVVGGCCPACTCMMHVTVGTFWLNDFLEVAIFHPRRAVMATGFW